MPEAPEVNAMAYTIRSGKGFPEGNKKYKKLQYYFMLPPLSFSLGSSKRAYQTVSVDNESSLPAVEIIPPWVSEQRSQHNPWPPQSWTAYGTGQPWEGLLKQTTPGNLFCATRGKLILLAAGHHAVVISLGLEAHIFGMPPSVFWSIICNDLSGPNGDPEKAERMRTFLIPEEYTVPNSAERSPRTIKIFAAFVSQSWVHVISDFSGLVRMHVRSKRTPYVQEDLEIGSQLWAHMFESFKGGPDWILEKPLAVDRLKSWRMAVLHQWRAYEGMKRHLQDEYLQKVKARNKELRSTLPIYHYFSRQITSRGNPALEPQQLPPIMMPKLPTPPYRPIIKELASNSQGAFSGVGRHLANDFLFIARIFPATPAHFICSDDTRFAAFEEEIHKYLAVFSSKRFLDPVTAVTNSKNPFSFNESSNSAYMTKHMHVFRRTFANVPHDLYNKYLQQGLLDPSHTISEPYTVLPTSKKPRSAGKYKKIQVYFYGGALKAYSIIQAKCPEEWGVIPEPTKVDMDVAQYGYRTTVGPAQFHEQLLNRVIKQAAAQKGRPKKITTGRPGRPPLLKNTKDAILRKEARLQGRVSSSASTSAPLFAYDDMDVDSAEVSDSGISPVALPSTMVNPDSADDNCGDANKHADGSAHNDTPFFIETSLAAIILSPANQTLLDIQMYRDGDDMSSVSRHIQMERTKNAFGPRIFRSEKLQDKTQNKNKKPRPPPPPPKVPTNIQLQKPLKVDTIEEILRYARKFNTLNPFCLPLNYDNRIPRGIMTAARAHQVLHAEENGDDQCFQQFLKNPTKKPSQYRK